MFGGRWGHSKYVPTQVGLNIDFLGCDFNLVYEPFKKNKFLKCETCFFQQKEIDNFAKSKNQGPKNKIIGSK